MGEMRPRRRGIVAVAQGDPAAHEMEIRPVMFAGRQGGIAHDLVGGFKLALIEQLAGETAPFAPPFVGILKRHGLRRGRQHQTGCVVDPVVTHHPADTAKRVSEIAAGLGRNVVEQIERLVGVARRTGLHDRKLVAAEALRSALGARKILGADALVHARTMVLAREQVAEQLERVGFGALRQFIRPPGLANQASGTVTIAFGEQRPARARSGPWRLSADRLRSCERWRRRCAPATGAPQPACA